MDLILITITFCVQKMNTLFFNYSLENFNLVLCRLNCIEFLEKHYVNISNKTKYFDICEYLILVKILIYLIKL